MTESEKDRRLAHLERELEGMRGSMRATAEEHEAVQEELRSAHEEMLSANEEFQSTNEELETSKEELQSTNEELTTTIDELRSRNQELARLNTELDAARRASEAARSYADTIIESVREPLAVLDGTLRILRANPAFAANLEIPREEIEGRFLHEVGDARWNIPDLHQRLRAVLANAQPLEDWEVTRDLSPQRRQVMSLSARRIPGDADRAEQLLLSIQDVTARADMTAGLVASVSRRISSSPCWDMSCATADADHTPIYLLRKRPPGSRHHRTARDDRYPVADTLAIRERAPGPVAYQSRPD